MKLTIIQVGITPKALRAEFGDYPPQFQDMFAAADDADFTFETVFVLDGAPMPDPKTLEGIIITGSAAGVYDDTLWMQPLRDFIAEAYALKIPMLGICFGHQIMADALGGKAEKSDKGWSLGRHVYEVTTKPEWLAHAPDQLAIAASHQDQVVEKPAIADVFLASSFTPYAGLAYHNGCAISMQPHPEFDADFSKGLVDIRLDNPLDEAGVATTKATLAHPVDNRTAATSFARFFKACKKARSS